MWGGFFFVVTFNDMGNYLFITENWKFIFTYTKFISNHRWPSWRCCLYKVEVSGKIGAETQTASASAIIVWEKEEYPTQDPRKVVSVWFQTIQDSTILFIDWSTHIGYVHWLIWVLSITHFFLTNGNPYHFSFSSIFL